MSIRREHREIIDAPYSESAIAALIIADELRRSTDEICKALAKLGDEIKEARQTSDPPTPRKFCKRL